MSFKLTYSTMYNPPAEMHQRFDAALATVRADLGRRHGLYIDGGDVMGESFISKYSRRTPNCCSGIFPRPARTMRCARSRLPVRRIRAGAHCRCVSGSHCCGGLRR